MCKRCRRKILVSWQRAVKVVCNRATCDVFLSGTSNFNIYWSWHFVYNSHHELHRNWLMQHPSACTVTPQIPPQRTFPAVVTLEWQSSPIHSKVASVAVILSIHPQGYAIGSTWGQSCGHTSSLHSVFLVTGTCFLLGLQVEYSVHAHNAECTPGSYVKYSTHVTHFHSHCRAVSVVILNTDLMWWLIWCDDLSYHPSCDIS